MASDRVLLGENKYGRKICLGRFSLKACVVFWVIFLLLSLLFALLIIFLYFLPSGIARTFQNGLELSTMRVAQVTFYPDRENHVLLVLEGKTIHPNPYWGYQGQLHTWAFLDKSNKLVFNSQPIVETEVTTENDRIRVFKSEMHIQLTNATNATINEILNELTYASEVRSTNTSLHRIEFTGRFGYGAAYIYQNLQFSKPIEELHRAIIASASTKLFQRGFDFSQIQLNRAHLKMTETGIHLSVNHTTTNFREKFQLPNGTYPVFSESTPVMLLNTKDNIRVQQNTQNGTINVNFEFLPEYDESGKVLFKALNAVGRPGQLALKGPAVEPNVPSTPERLRAMSSLKTLEIPRFLNPIGTLLTCLQNGKYDVRSFVVKKNLMHIGVQVYFYEFAEQLGHITMDFGIQFKVIADNAHLLDGAITSVTIHGHKKNPYIYLQLVFIFPQETTEIESTAHLMDSLLATTDTDVNLRIQGIHFIPIEPAGMKLQCVWCSTLFSKVDIPLCFSSHCFKLKFLNALFNRKYAVSPPVNVDLPSLKLANRNGSSIIEFQTTMDMRWLRSPLRLIQLPKATSMVMKYRNQDLVKIVLPKGFDWSARNNERAFISLELHMRNDPEVQPLFEELLDIFIYERRTDDLIHFTELLLGEGNCTIRSFRSHAWWIPPKQIYTLVKEWTQWEWAKAKLPSLLALTAMHIRVVDGHHFLVSGEIGLNARFPVTLDFDSVSFEIAVSDFETFHVALPSFKINQSETTLKFDQVYIITKGKEPLHSKLLSLSQYEMELNETTSTLGNFKLARKSTFSLDSFSQFYYTFGAAAFQSLWKKLDLFKVKRMLNGLQVLNIHPLDIKETKEDQFVMHLEIDTTLTKDFSLDIPFISFDYVAQGVKRGEFGIDMMRTPNEKGEKLKLQIVFDIAREPFEEVEACKTEQKNNASICLWRLAIAESKLTKPDASSTPIMLQDTLFTKDLALLHPFLQAQLTKKQLRKLAPFFLLDIPKYELPDHKIRSAGVKLEENAATLDFEMDIPPSSFDIEGFRADTYLASNEHDVLKMFVEAQDVVTEESRTAFRLHLEITFLELPLITNPKNLMKRNVNHHALISGQTLLDSVFSSVWSLKFENYQGSEEMLEYLSHLKGMPQLNAFQWSDLKQFVLNSLDLEVMYKNMTPGFSTLLLPQPFNQSLTISSGTIKVSGQTQNTVHVNLLPAFRFDPAHAPPFPVHITIEASKADVLLDGFPLGVLELSSKFECRHCLENGMQANFSHAFINHEESKEKVGDIINAIINGTFLPGNISLLNFRSRYETPPSKTLFNLFTLSTSLETIRKWVLQMLPARPAKPDDTEAKTKEDKEGDDEEATSVGSYSKLDFDDDKLEVKTNSFLPTLVTVRSMVLFVDIDDNFQLGISIPWLTWNGKSFNQSRIEFSFRQLQGAEFSLEKLTRNFTMSQWIIGDSASFPTQRTHLDLFSKMKLSSRAFEPYMHVFETIRTFKWHELRLEDNITTTNAYLRATLNYSQQKIPPCMLLPNFQVRVALSTFTSLRIKTYHLPSSTAHPQQMQIELYSELAQSPFNVMHSEVRTQMAQMYGFLLRIVMWTDPISGQSQSLENLIIYIDQELSDTMTNQFFDHTTDLFTHPSPYHAIDEIPVLPDVEDRSTTGEAWYYLRVRTPAFFNLYVNVGLIRIGFQNTLDDMDYTFSVHFANVSAVTTTHGFYLCMALVVKSGTKNPLIKDNVLGWNIPAIAYGISPDHIHVLNWPVISMESKLALSFAKAFKAPYQKLRSFIAEYLGNSMSVQRLDVNFPDRIRTEYTRVEAEFSPVRQDPTAFQQQKEMYHVQIRGRDMTLMMNQKHVALHAFSLDTNATITMISEFELPNADVLQNIVGSLLQFYVPEYSVGKRAHIVIDEVRFSSPTPLPMEFEFVMPVNYFDFAPVLPTKDTAIWQEGIIAISRKQILSISFLLARTNTSKQLSVKANFLKLYTTMILDNDQFPMLELRRLSVDSEIKGEFRFLPGIIDFEKMSNLLYVPDPLQFQNLTFHVGSAFEKLVTPPIHFGDFNPFVLPSFYTIKGVRDKTGSILSMEKGFWGALVPYYKMTFRHRWTTRTVEGGLALSPQFTEVCIQNSLPHEIGQSLHDLRDIYVEDIAIGVSSSLNVPLKNMKLVVNPNKTVGIPEWRRIPLQNTLKCNSRFHKERENIPVKGPSEFRP